MASGEFADKLAALTDWKEKMNAPDTVPDGRYILQLESAELAQSSSSDRIMVKRRHSVVGGEYDGMPVFDNIILDTDFGPRQFKRWVEALEYPAPEDPAAIEALVDTIAAERPVCSAQVRTSRNGFTNVIVLGRETLGTPGFAPQNPRIVPPTKPLAPTTKPDLGQTTPPTAAVQPAVEQPAAPKPGSTPAVAVRKVVSARAQLPPAQTPKQNPSKEALLAFAVGQGYDVNADMSYDDLVKVIKSEAYQTSLLLPEEKTLLTDIGATLV